MKPRPIRIDGDVAYITLTKGYTAVIDVVDVDLVAGYNWCAAVKNCGRSIYAARGLPKSECGAGKLLLHRAIMDAPDGMDVDHIDGNGLNNTRANLRLATKAQNCHNSRPQKNGASKFKGVCFHKKTGKWQAKIKLNYKRIWLGCHDTEEAAHAAYCEASERFHGEFGRVE